MALRSITYYGQAGPIDNIEQNIIWYLRDELLKTGAYYNIATGFLGYNGEDLSVLRPSYQPEHANFQFFAGLSNNWIWESGVIDTNNDGTPDVNTTYLTAPPIAVSGIYINNTFYPTATTTGTYAHYIDYNRGGVVFTSAKASTLVVKCQRSERAAFVYPAQSDEYRSLIHRFRRTTSLPPGSGIDTYSPENKAMMPAIFVSAQQKSSTPHELGNLTNVTSFRINFDIVAEHIGELNKLRAVCAGLEGYTVGMFDVSLAATGDFPLDYLGRLRTGYKTRETLVADHYWKPGRFQNDAFEQIFSPILPIHRARVSLTFDILL